VSSQSIAGFALGKITFGTDSESEMCYNYVLAYPAGALSFGGSLTGTARKPTGLTLFEAIDDISMVAAPGYANADAYAALQAHVEHPLRQDRMAILDTVEKVDEVGALTRAATSGLPDEPEPDKPENPEEPAKPAKPGKPEEAAKPEETAPAAGATSEDALGAPQSPGGYTALYFPWIVMTDPVSGKKVTQPPSGHMAGVWARVDGSRGVHRRRPQRRQAYRHCVHRNGHSEPQVV